MEKIKKSYEPDWQMLYGLMQDTIYGGRIDNDIDLRILDTYIK